MAHPSYRAHAKHLGLSDPMYIRELRDKGMPLNTLAAAEKWYKANVRTTATQAAGSPAGSPAVDPADAGDGIDPDNAGSDKLFHEARRMKADADLKELEVRRRRNELVDRDVVERWVSKRFSLITARLTAIPDELAGQLPTTVRTSTVKWLEDFFERLLVELSEPPEFEDERAAA